MYIEQYIHSLSSICATRLILFLGNTTIVIKIDFLFYIFIYLLSQVQIGFTQFCSWDCVYGRTFKTYFSMNCVFPVWRISVQWFFYACCKFWNKLTVYCGHECLIEYCYWRIMFCHGIFVLVYCVDSWIAHSWKVVLY